MCVSARQSVGVRLPHTGRQLPPPRSDRFTLFVNNISRAHGSLVASLLAKMTSWINGARDALCPTPLTAATLSSPAQSLFLVGACAAAAGLLLGALSVLFLLNRNKKSDGGDGDARVPRYHSRADEFFDRTAEDGAAPPLPSSSPARTPTSALLAGIRVSLAECGGEHGDDTSPDVSRPLSEAFQITQRTTAGRGMAGFEFVEYAPSIFWRIRRLYGVSEAELQESLGSVSESFALGEGKGGCMFLPTSDRRFLMKTVKEDEKEKLLHILEDYYGALVYQLRALYALCVRCVYCAPSRVSVCG